MASAVNYCCGQFIIWPMVDQTSNQAEERKRFCSVRLRRNHALTQSRIYWHLCTTTAKAPLLLLLLLLLLWSCLGRIPEPYELRLWLLFFLSLLTNSFAYSPKTISVWLNDCGCCGGVVHKLLLILAIQSQSGWMMTKSRVCGVKEKER